MLQAFTFMCFADVCAIVSVFASLVCLQSLLTSFRNTIARKYPDKFIAKSFKTVCQPQPYLTAILRKLNLVSLLLLWIKVDQIIIIPLRNKFSCIHATLKEKLTVTSRSLQVIKHLIKVIFFSVELKGFFTLIFIKSLYISIDVNFMLSRTALLDLSCNRKLRLLLNYYPKALFVHFQFRL